MKRAKNVGSIYVTVQSVFFMFVLFKKVVPLVLMGPDHVQVFRKHKSFGNISQLETRPLIGWSSDWTNQRIGFQLTYVSKTLMLPKHLRMIRPLIFYPQNFSREIEVAIYIFFFLKKIFCNRNPNFAVTAQQIEWAEVVVCKGIKAV